MIVFTLPSFPYVFKLIKDYFPSFHIGAATVVMGLVLMFVFGLVTGAWPALTAMRLKIVDALRRI